MADQNLTTEELESEEWRNIPGFPGYQASNIGRVRSVKITVLKCRPGRNPAYFSVSLQRKGHKAVSRGIHQLVASAFIGPRPSGMLVNHKDTNKRNNRFPNLEYRTHQGNAQHASENGLLLMGQDNPASKLTEQQVAEILGRLAAGEMGRDICADYSVSDVVVSLIRRGKAWKNVERPVGLYEGPLPNWAKIHPERLARGDQNGSRKHSERLPCGEDSHNAKVTAIEVQTIRSLYATGNYTMKELANNFGLGTSQTNRIIKRLTWKHL